MADFHAPLGVLLGHFHQVSRQHRLADEHTGVRVSGSQHQRRPTSESVVETADAVSQPAGDMDVGERRLAGGPGVTVRHPHRRAFLQRLDVLQLRIILQPVEERRFAGAGVAENIFHSLCHQHLRQSVLAKHPRHNNFSCVVIRRGE